MDKLRNNITTTLQQLGEKTGSYQTPWTVTYKILCQRTHCRFKARLRHLRKKAMKQGLSKSEADRLNVLDVLDRPLMTLYWYIVKEYSGKENRK